MKTSKINIGLQISRNYNKVILEILEEPIEYDSEEEFNAKIRKIFNQLRGEVDLEFTKMKK